MTDKSNYRLGKLEAGQPGQNSYNKTTAENG
jgi:hypothetical protein